MAGTKQCAGCGSQMAAAARECPVCGRGSRTSDLRMIAFLGVLLLGIGLASGLIPIKRPAAQPEALPIQVAAPPRPETPKATSPRQTSQAQRPAWPPRTAIRLPGSARVRRRRCARTRTAPPWEFPAKHRLATRAHRRTPRRPRPRRCTPRPLSRSSTPPTTRSDADAIPARGQLPVPDRGSGRCRRRSTSAGRYPASNRTGQLLGTNGSGTVAGTHAPRGCEPKNTTSHASARTSD